MPEAKYTTAEYLAAAPSERAPNVVHARWLGGQRFETGRPEGPMVQLDGEGSTGPSPVDILLSALATCVAIDVVMILEKRRTPVRSLEMEVTGARVDTTPRRIKRVLIDMKMSGAGIERDQAERAIQLSVEKYCSVRDSIDPNIPVDWRLELGEGSEDITAGG